MLPIANNTWQPQSLTFAAGNWVLLMSYASETPMITNITSGLLDISTAAITQFGAYWPSNLYAFVINSISVYNPDSNVIYSIVGNGFGPPVALCTSNGGTGNFMNGVVFGQREGSYQQPQFIAYFPDSS